MFHFLSTAKLVHVRSICESTFPSGMCGELLSVCVSHVLRNAALPFSGQLEILHLIPNAERNTFSKLLRKNLTADHR